MFSQGVPFSHPSSVFKSGLPSLLDILSSPDRLAQRSDKPSSRTSPGGSDGPPSASVVTALVKGITQLPPFPPRSAFPSSRLACLPPVPRQPAAPRPAHARASPGSAGGPRGPLARWVGSVCAPGRRRCSDAAAPALPRARRCQRVHGLSLLSPPSFTRSSRPPAHSRSPCLCQSRPGQNFLASHRALRASRPAPASAFVVLKSIPTHTWVSW